MKFYSFLKFALVSLFIVAAAGICLFTVAAIASANGCSVNMEPFAVGMLVSVASIGLDYLVLAGIWKIQSQESPYYWDKDTVISGIEYYAFETSF